MLMRSFAWTWIVALSLFGVGAPAPECGASAEVEELEALRGPERESLVRKKTPPAPSIAPTPAPAASVPAWRLVSTPAPAIGVWIARTHQRSPTA
jgi:hypothetical protein